MFNSITAAAYLVKDPEVRQTSTGKKVANLRAGISTSNAKTKCFIDFQNKYNQKETDKRFSLGANLSISNKIVDIKRAILQFNDKDSLIIIFCKNIFHL